MSEKSVAEKLLIKSEHKVLVLSAPDGYTEAMGSLHDNVSCFARQEGEADIIQVFVKSRRELEARLPGLKALLKPKGLLWVTYPKGSAKAKVDINRDSIHSYAQSLGLQAVAMISVDDTWSALRLKKV